MSLVDTLLKNAYQDTQLLIKNDERGDVLSVPRDVDFLLRCEDSGRAETVASFVNDNQYGVAVVEQVDDEYRVRITVHTPITQNVLCSISGLMACLSELFQVVYDGWGSTIKPAA